MPSVRKGGRQGPYRSIVEVLSWPMSNDLYLSVHCRHRGNVQKAKNHPVQPTPKIKIDVVFSTAFLPSTRQLFCVLLLTHRNLPRPKKGLGLQHTLSTIGIGGRRDQRRHAFFLHPFFNFAFAKAPKQCCNAAAAGGVLVATSFLLEFSPTCIVQPCSPTTPPSWPPPAPPSTT